MKNKLSEFPWYMVYTPILTILMGLWIWDNQTGEKSMDVLEKVLTWLKLDDTMVTNVVIIALVLLAVLYIFIRWFGTSKKLKAIKEVSDTAPEALKKHISSSCTDLGERICNSISEDKLRISNDIAKIEANTSFLMTERATAPVQQKQLFSEISSLYAVHDRDQHLISILREENALLKAQNAELKKNNQKLCFKLDRVQKSINHRMNRQTPTPSDGERNYELEM